jgi:HD-GYP domain-containing protein (c-di-GMP phosphodiesterase class II)
MRDQIAMDMPIDVGNGSLGRELYRPSVLLAYTRQIETYHPDVSAHGRNVAKHNAIMAAELGITAERAIDLQLAGALHDIGKVAIPRRVLDKPGPLTEEEWSLMRAHPAIGAAIVDAAGLYEIAPWILAHHERPDGGGYPQGLIGSQIPFEARMVAVTDAYDAMTTDRPYRAALSHEEAIEELIAGAGSQFDSEIVDAFASTIDASAGALSGSRH